MKKYMIFFAPDAGGGEGGGGQAGALTQEAQPPQTRGADVFTPAKIGNERPLPTDKVEKQIATHDPQQPAGGEPSSGTPGASTPIPFDPSKFAKEIGEAFGTKVTEQKKTEPAKLSPEEAAKLLNVWEPDDAWYKEYDNLETRASAVKKMRDGMVKQSDTIAQLRMHELIETLKSELAPQLKEVTEFATQQREERFNRTFPVLAKPELKPLIVAVANDMATKGQKFNSETEMFQALGKGVEAVIKATNPDFKLDAQASTNNNTGRPSSGIPTTSPGSGGGAGQHTPAAKTAPSRGIAIFGS